ncbi:unnamed protein product [Soboliphyme baturini]|uniref:Cytochrome c oxidase subunit 5B, mitochondrial n=1 Tax=Soboliphyme baturini TaxID=241478 RepID=A0A183J0V0_9BILA|nr:unnamed protein product [Soboliphyme baturini]
MRGDRKFEPHCYTWSRATSPDKPNVVPSSSDNRIIGCNPEQMYINYMWVRKGQMKRCGCGYWFKLVDEPKVEGPRV